MNRLELQVGVHFGVFDRALQIIWTQQPSSSDVHYPKPDPPPPPPPR